MRNAIHSRIRRKVKGDTERPRLAIYRSLNHIYAQVIDDRLGKTLVSASTTEKGIFVAIAAAISTPPGASAPPSPNVLSPRESSRWFSIVVVTFITGE